MTNTAIMLGSRLLRQSADAYDRAGVAAPDVGHLAGPVDALDQPGITGAEFGALSAMH
jgi:hypothetical protein